MKSIMTGYLVPMAASLLILGGCGGEGGGSEAVNTTAVMPPAILVSGTPLGALTDPADGGTATASFSLAVDVNNSNKIIGYAETAAGSVFKAALWTVNADGNTASAPTSLKPLGANSFSAAFSIDDNTGIVVGQSTKAAAVVAVLWKPGVAEPFELPALPDATGNSKALGISPDGSMIAGEAQDGALITRAVLWRADASGDFTAPPQVLPVNIFARGGVLSSFSSASGVNNNGWIAGVADDGDGVSHAVLWRPDPVSGIHAATDLRIGVEVGSTAFAVSATGQVVGESETADGVFAAVLWTEQPGGGFTRTDLAAEGSALAINSVNRAGGSAGASPRATVWALPGGAATALYNLPSQVYGLNDTNLIVGFYNGKGFVAKMN